MKSDKPIPYKPARLVIPSEGAKKQLLTVVAWIYDVSLGKKVRKQFNYFNNEVTYPTYEDKLAEANRFLKKLNQRLEKGAYIESSKKRVAEKEVVITSNDKHQLIPELNTVLKAKSKLRGNTTDTYFAYIKVFCEWLNSKGPLYYEDFTEATWEIFFDYLVRVRKIKSNRSINNYHTTISTFFNAIDKRLKIKHNFLESIQKLPEDEGRNIAFNDRQVKQLMDFMTEKCPEMIFPCKLMFYTFLRTNEITSLKINQVGVPQKNQIYLQPSRSKSRANRYAIIPEDLQIEFDKLDLSKYSGNHYLIGNVNTMSPGLSPLGRNALSQKFRRRVLDPLGYSEDYTYYSWKHTGVTWAKLKGGLTDASIFLQGGWKDWHSFAKYLKSLGLMDNSDFADKMPKLLP